MEIAKQFKLEIIKHGDNVSFPKKGNTVRVHYESYNTKTGQKIDSSRERNDTFEFVLGLGQVIPGWEKVMPEMSLGEIVRFILPPDEAYGNGGLPGILPPGATLTFEVELISFE